MGQMVVRRWGARGNRIGRMGLMDRIGQIGNASEFGNRKMNPARGAALERALRGHRDRMQRGGRGGGQRGGRNRAVRLRLN